MEKDMNTSLSMYEYNFFFQETAWRDIQDFLQKDHFFEMPFLICDVTSALDKITLLSISVSLGSVPCLL